MTTLATTLRDLLAHNIVRFTFAKRDGSIRNAIGTRNLSLADNYSGYSIPRPKGAEQPNSYYDLEKNGWRSYVPENLVSIDEVIPCPQHQHTQPKAETPAEERKPLSTEDFFGDLNGIVKMMFGGIPLADNTPAVTSDNKRDLLIERAEETKRVLASACNSAICLIDDLISQISAR